MTCWDLWILKWIMPNEEFIWFHWIKVLKNLYLQMLQSLWCLDDMLVRTVGCFGCRRSLQWRGGGLEHQPDSGSCLGSDWDVFRQSQRACVPGAEQTNGLWVHAEWTQSTIKEFCWKSKMKFPIFPGCLGAPAKERRLWGSERLLRWKSAVVACGLVSDQAGSEWWIRFSQTANSTQHQCWSEGENQTLKVCSST